MQAAVAQSAAWRLVHMIKLTATREIHGIRTKSGKRHSIRFVSSLDPSSFLMALGFGFAVKPSVDLCRSSSLMVQRLGLAVLP
jgi:hypothetical protein